MAGKYDFESKFGALKIKDDERVDEFMDSYPTSRTTTKVYIAFYSIYCFSVYVLRTVLCVFSLTSG